MASFPTIKIVPSKQVHPRVLQEDKACIDCIHFTPSVAIHERDGFCILKNCYVNNYDECGAFTRRPAPSKE